jgi:hypothetical protein
MKGQIAPIDFFPYDNFRRILWGLYRFFFHAVILLRLVKSLSRILGAWVTPKINNYLLSEVIVLYMILELQLL